MLRMSVQALGQQGEHAGQNEFPTFSWINPFCKELFKKHRD